AEPQLERDVDHDEAGELVVQEAVVAQWRRQREREEQAEKGNDEDLGRQQAAGREHDEQREIQPARQPRDSERDHRRQDEDEDDGRDDDDGGVQEEPWQLGAGPGVRIVRERQLARRRNVASGGGVGVRPERGVHGPEHRQQPEQRDDRKEQVEPETTPAGAARHGAHSASRPSAQRMKIAIGMIEASSSSVAAADPYPIRLASPSRLLTTRTDSSSRPLRPRLITYTTSKARRASIVVITTTTTLIG